MGVFEVLASTGKETETRRAIIAAQSRAQDAFAEFLAADPVNRLNLINDDLQRVVAQACADFGSDELETVYQNTLDHLAGGHKSECGCGFCLNKGSFGKDDNKEDEDDFSVEAEKEKSAKTASVATPVIFLDDLRKASKANTSAFQWVACTDGECGDCPECEGKKEAAVKEAEYKYVKKQGDKWVIIQKGTGKVLSTHDSEEKAQSAFRAMEMNMHGGAVTAADAPTGDHYQSERVELPSADASGLGGPSPKIDKGTAGDEAGSSQKPIEIDSVRNVLDRQDVADTADYTDQDFTKDLSSPVHTDDDVTRSVGPPDTDNTKTWTEAENTPVTSKWQLLEV